MEEIITNIAAQWGAVGVLVISLICLAIAWYKYIIAKEKESREEREMMSKLHREERERRADRDDERLWKYQESVNMNVLAIHWLEKTMAEVRTLIDSKMG